MITGTTTLVELKSVSMELGAKSVTTSGKTMMQVFSADNLDSLLMVIHSIQNTVLRLMNMF